VSAQFSDVPLSYLAQSLVETVAFLTIAVVGLVRVRRGAWGVLAMVGGLLAGAVTAYYLAMDAELRWMDSYRLVMWSVNHRTASDAIGWARAAGVVLVAAAFVLLTRTTKTRSTP
jgi:hypothetical protein